MACLQADVKEISLELRKVALVALHKSNLGGDVSQRIFRNLVTTQVEWFFNIS